MPYKTWHNYGYGICTDKIKTTPERIAKLLALAPQYRAMLHAHFADCEIDEPTVEDYTETAGQFDGDSYCDMASLLKAVIEETEGIELIACDDYDCRYYLIYPPCYPWQITDADKEMTEEKLRLLYAKYVNILTDDVLDVDYQSAENGG